jgi:tetratricopeptide (TPR) repeat protein
MSHNVCGSRNEKLIKGIFGALLLLGLTAAFTAKVESAIFQPLEKDVETAVLAEQWQKVVDLLEARKDLGKSPVARMVKGHACLALNRNNESLCLFMSVSSAEELAEWDRWAKALAQSNPRNAVAHYFSGDASARLQKWESAPEAFEKARGVNPRHALTWNATGVYLAAMGQTDKALTAFMSAAESNPGFADAYANMGALAIQEKDGARGALDDFDVALVPNLSPDFAIALYGRGCVRAVLGRWDEAQKDIEDAATKSGCLKGLIEGSVSRMLEYIDTQSRRQIELAKASGENPEMRIDADIKKIANGDARAVNDIVNTLGVYKDKALEQRTLEKIDNFMRDPTVSNDAKKRFMSQVGEVGGINGFVDRMGQGLFRATSEQRTYTWSDGTKMGLEGNMGLKDKINVGGKIGQESSTTFERMQQGTPGKAPWHQWIDNCRYKKDFAQQVESLGRQPGIDFKSKADGFKTGIEEGSWDREGWPFTPQYGLMYEPASKNNPPASGVNKE